ncbi:MAG TPA: hypothetical protein VFE86_00980 [Ilumatobacteraceae bacterium]|nr:hypothetical protein [Ilumatobacteraceae bacterium]
MKARATGQALLLRGLVLTSPLVAIFCTGLAAGRTLPALDVAVAGLALACAALPDSHAGLLVVALVGIGWWATVDDRLTPWSLAAALALAVFHASMAAASVAPLAAKWTPAMSRRWLRRTAVVGAATCVMWAVVALIGDHRFSGNSLLLAAALVGLAFAALWARTGSIGQRSGAH